MRPSHAFGSEIAASTTDYLAYVWLSTGFHLARPGLPGQLLAPPSDTGTLSNGAKLAGCNRRDGDRPTNPGLALPRHFSDL